MPTSAPLPRALVRGEGGGARLVALCPRARAAGVHVGMTQAEARARLPSLATTPLDPARIEAVEARVVDALVTVSPRLGRAGPGLRPSLATHDDFLLDVQSPADVEQLAEIVRDLDLGAATLGVADGAFAAICAAQVVEPRLDAPEPRRKLVPRDGDAAFLAPLPIALLPAAPETLEALRALGLDTLALVAALPLEGVHARLGEEGRALIALARGAHTPAVATFLPSAEPSAVVDLVDADPACEGAVTLDAILFALRTACHRLVPPLAAQGSGLGEVELVLEGRHAPTRLLLRPARPELDPQALFELARATLEGARRGHALGPVRRLRLTATAQVDVEHSGERLPFARRDATVLPLDVALARLRGRFGADRIVTPVRSEDPRPDGRGVFRPVDAQLVPERATTPPPTPLLRERLRAPSRALGAVILSRAPIVGDPWPIRATGAMGSAGAAGAAGGDPRGRHVVREIGPPERVASGWWSEPFDLIYRWIVRDDGARALFARASEGGAFRLIGVAD